MSFSCPARIYTIKIPFLKDNPFRKNCDIEFNQFMYNIIYKNNFNEYITDDDVIKSEKFLFFNDSIRYLMTRVFIKKILSKELNLSHDLIQFSYGKYKKPFLNLNNLKKNIYFNVSHSREYIAIATSFIGEIGIDIEYKDFSINFDLMKSQFFSDFEEKYFNQLENENDKVNYFYRIWSLKEAILKGIGVGLFYSPNLLSVLSSNSLQTKIINLSVCDQEENFSSWINYIIDFNDSYALAFSHKGELQKYETIYLDYSN
nr:hypothetical protein GTC16762_04120 [Pigmentibacter ruber]